MPLIYFSSLMHATSSIVYYFSSTRCRCQLRCRPFFCQLVNSWRGHAMSKTEPPILRCALAPLWACGSPSCCSSCPAAVLHAGHHFRVACGHASEANQLHGVSKNYLRTHHCVPSMSLWSLKIS